MQAKANTTIRAQHASFYAAATTAITTIASVASLMLGSLASTPAQAQQTMKIGLATVNDVQHEFAKLFAAQMEKTAPGKLRIQVYPSEQLGSIPRMVEGMGMGTVEAWVGPPEFMVGIEPRMQVFGAPGLVFDMEHGYRLTQDERFRQASFSWAEAKGIKGLGLVVYGPNGYTSKKALRTLADWKGQKLRVFGSPMHTVAMEKLGATGVPMNPADALQAISSGAIDGNRTALNVSVSFKYFDVVKNHTMIDGEALIYSMFAVSKGWYDKLPADVQKQVAAAVVAVEREAYNFAVEGQKRSEATWAKNGELIRVNVADQADFVRRMQTVGPEVVAKNPRIKDAYELMVERANATRK
jgi:hypothetical protein